MNDDTEEKDCELPDRPYVRAYYATTRLVNGQVIYSLTRTDGKTWPK